MDNKFIQQLPVAMVRRLVVAGGGGDGLTLGHSECILKALCRYLRARMGHWERLVFLMLTR